MELAVKADIGAAFYKAWLFIKRGFLTTLSYRVALLLGLLSSFVGILQFGFMAHFLSDGNSFPLLQPYGGNLLAYLIVGSAFTGFVGVSLNSFQGAVRNEQNMGTLEYLLLSDTRLALILFYSAVWSFINTLANTAILLGVVSLLLNIQWDINFLSAILILILTIVSLSGIGLMSAGVIMVTKQGDPIGWIFTTLSGLLSGVLFPVEVLPPGLQVLANLLPTTHALKGLRLALIQGSTLATIMPEILFLIVTACLTIPLGLLVFKKGFDKARRQGSLAEY